jgi:beta-aspartyl-dipeptidase (metallo-type)
MILFKNCKIYSPEPLPATQVLVAGEKVIAIEESIRIEGCEVDIHDLEGRCLCPGFIDQHVHITGGGGQFGPASFIPEITMQELVATGTTTVVGLLGTDGIVKELSSLYNKTKALEAQGMTAFMLTNYYGLPEKTMTGSVSGDMVFIDRVIGCKLALSDDRSSFPTKQEILRLVSEIRRGGFTSGKHGILHIHLGDLPQNIDVIHAILDEYPTLVSYFSPTHCIRTAPLFEACVKFAQRGGMMDISTGGTQFTDPHKAVALALEMGAPLENLTFSSDGRGGVKKIDLVTGEVTYTPAPVDKNLKEMIRLVKERILPLEKALMLLTTNPAKNLSLAGKGRIAVGNDADFVVLNDNLSLSEVWAKGRKVK